MSYRVVRSRKIYQGHVVELFKDRLIVNSHPRKVITRELIKHPGAVAVIPYVDRDHILILRQFRYAAKGDLWEIPAGTREKNEPTLVCARRELEEETGFKAKRWKLLTRFFPAPGVTNEIMTLYKAGGLFEGRKNLDHDEYIEHHVISLKKARQMIRDGRIRDAKTIVGVLWVSVLFIFYLFVSLNTCEASTRREGHVHWVVDGDTFKLDTGERIRLIGVDTPEYQPWKGRIDFYGKEASEFSKKYLSRKKVFLESDIQEKDKYNRTLAYVYLENGEFVNKVLVDEGYARAKYYPPNNRYRQILKTAEQTAKKIAKECGG